MDQFPGTFQGYTVFATTQQIDTAMDGNRPEPRPESIRILQLVQPLVGLDKDLLRRILRIAGIPQAGQCDAEHGMLVSCHNRPECFRSVVPCAYHKTMIFGVLFQSGSPL